MRYRRTSSPTRNAFHLHKKTGRRAYIDYVYTAVALHPLLFLYPYDFSLFVEEVALAVKVLKCRLAQSCRVEQSLGRVFHHEVVRHGKRLQGYAFRQDFPKRDSAGIHNAVLMAGERKSEMGHVIIGSSTDFLTFTFSAICID